MSSTSPISRFFIPLFLFVTIHSNIVASVDPLENLMSPDYIQKLVAKFKPIMQAMTERNILNYGDKCNPSIEKIRTSMGADFSEQLQKDPLGLIMKMGEIIDKAGELADVENNFCTSSKYLACNAETHTCDCFNGTNEHNLSFKFETIWQDGKCVGTEGTMCTSSEVTQSSAPMAQQLGVEPQQALTCQAGKTCLIKESKKPCTFANLANEFGNESVGNFLQKGLEVCACSSTIPKHEL